MAVVKRAGEYSLPPTRMPTADESHTDVAVVSPWTSGTVLGPLLSLSLGSFARVPFQIEAAPRKPTPEGMAADTRDASHAIGPAMKANVDATVKTHAPRQTRAIVRMPAARSARRRSKPMSEPQASDITTRTFMSASHGDMPINTGRRSFKHGS